MDNEHPDDNGDTGVERRSGSTTGMPRWVKVSGIVALVIVLLFVILLLTGGPNRHGPGRHVGPSEDGGQTPSSTVGELAGIPNHGG